LISTSKLKYGTAATEDQLIVFTPDSGSGTYAFRAHLGQDEDRKDLGLVAHQRPSTSPDDR